MPRAATIITKYAGLLNPFRMPSRKVDIRDIAHALGAYPRFGGFTDRPWTVLQHSLLIEWIMSMHGLPYRLRLLGLLHDAHEAYLLGDIPTPIKSNIWVHTGKEKHKGYTFILDALRDVQARILKAFSINLPDQDEEDIVKVYDELCVELEAYHLGLRDAFPHPRFKCIKEGGALIEALVGAVNLRQRFIDRTLALTAAARLEKSVQSEAAGSTSQTPGYPKTLIVDPADPLEWGGQEAQS